MKKIFTIILGLLLFTSVTAADIDFFYSKTCPHCAAEKVFLEKLKEEQPEITIDKYVVSENIELLNTYYDKYDVKKSERGLVPITFTDHEYFLGFDKKVEQSIRDCISGDVCPNKKGKSNDSEVSIPIIGDIDTGKYSLGALAIMFGFFDGFNICSLGALVLILSLVLSFKKRKKVIVFGSIFIITTGIIYGLLIVLWYQLFSYVGQYLRIMELIIGLLGIGGGLYFFKEWWRFRKYGPTCESTNNGIVNRISSKMGEIIHGNKSIFLTMGAVFVFALVITVVEFPCSAALPVFFAGLLSQAGLSNLSYLIYISLFILFYMLDEIIIFILAVLTMKLRLSNPKATVWITLLEAIMLFTLGLFYIIGL